MKRRGPNPKPVVICSIRGCVNLVTKYKGAGLCTTHYDKQRIQGRELLCSIQGCGKWAHTIKSQLCSYHYDIDRESRRNTYCIWQGCNLPTYVISTQMCNKHNRIFRDYHITSDSYHDMLNLQNNCCLICGGAFNDQFPPVIDHDHSCCSVKSTSCGKCVRGLAHDPCNAMEGKVRKMVESGIRPVNLEWMVK